MIVALAVVAWLIMAYFIIREICYEQLDDEGVLTLKFWTGCIFLCTVFAPIVFFGMFFLAEKSAVRRAFFLPPKPAEREFIRTRQALGNIFSIKEQ